MPKPCRDSTHEKKINKNGHAGCLTCGRAYQRNRRATKLGLQPIVAGETAHQAGARRMWAMRRDRHGGVTPEHSKKLRAAMEKRHRENGHYLSKRTHCKRGHRLDDKNTKVTVSRRTGGKLRRCLACREFLRRGRPEWVEKDKVRVSIKAHDAFHRAEHDRWREAMLASHPDKGGTGLKFVAARKQFHRFIDDEVRWYRQFGLMPPDMKRK